ncbi:FK506-binding protein 3-like [Rhodamnia argentea]|uniref:FK506-binding protein 3-like n=1 Tax=Rhodamnia argentea TaxID=178133 RepID=A0ABM3GYP6_9MYRT|nr:FK506-binding protein 3-like [Rhodamnia argentea]
MKLEDFATARRSIFPDLVTYFYSTMCFKDFNSLFYNIGDVRYQLHVRKLAKLMDVEEMDFVPLEIQLEAAYSFIIGRENYSRESKAHIVYNNFLLKHIVMHKKRLQRDQPKEKKTIASKGRVFESFKEADVDEDEFELEDSKDKSTPSISSVDVHDAQIDDDADKDAADVVGDTTGAHEHEDPKDKEEDLHKTHEQSKDADEEENSAKKMWAEDVTNGDKSAKRKEDEFFREQHEELWDTQRNEIEHAINTNEPIHSLKFSKDEIQVDKPDMFLIVGMEVAGSLQPTEDNATAQGEQNLLKESTDVVREEVLKEKEPVVVELEKALRDYVLTTTKDHENQPEEGAQEGDKEHMDIPSSSKSPPPPPVSN